MHNVLIRYFSVPFLMGESIYVGATPLTSVIIEFDSSDDDSETDDEI